MVSSLDDRLVVHEPRCPRRDIQQRSHPVWENPSLNFRSARVGRGLGINTAILRTSHATHKEAEAILYQLHEFDFYIGVFAVVPFLRSISHNARQNISCLTMYLHYLSENMDGHLGPLGVQALFRENLTDWSPACAYIAQNVRLREFAFHMQFEARKEFQHLPWVQAMAQIKGLWKLTYYNCNDAYYTEAHAKLGAEDQDRLTTGISVRNQALLSYLRSQILASTTTRC